jgi:hypothetical protein
MLWLFNCQEIQGDSKLLSGFQLPIIFKPKTTRKLHAEYENVTQEVLLGDAIFTALIFGRKYDAIPQNGDC